VQTFTQDGTLVETPVDKKGRIFNEDGGGSIIPPAEINVSLPYGGNFWGTSMIVRPFTVVRHLDLVRRRHPCRWLADRRRQRGIGCEVRARCGGPVDRVVLHDELAQSLRR
jgi:hypothetical protein